MPRPRRRSEFRRQERWARRHVRLNSYQDKVLSESVNVLTQGDVQRALQTQFEAVWMGVPKMFVEGEILSNSKGTGSLQQGDDENE